MPLCVISVSLVIPVGHMVRMLCLLAQFMSTRSALNMTFDHRILTARCHSMTITKHQEVSKIMHFKWLVHPKWWIVIIYSVKTPLSLTDPYDAFEGLRAEECGVLNGCENGRCVRVQEGYTCDCFDGYTLDMSRMACVGEREQSLTWGDQAGFSGCGWD